MEKKLDSKTMTFILLGIALLVAVGLWRLAGRTIVSSAMAGVVMTGIGGMIVGGLSGFLRPFIMSLGLVLCGIIMTYIHNSNRINSLIRGPREIIIFIVIFLGVWLAGTWMLTRDQQDEA